MIFDVPQTKWTYAMVWGRGGLDKNVGGKLEIKKIKITKLKRGQRYQAYIKVTQILRGSLFWDTL